MSTVLKNQTEASLKVLGQNKKLGDHLIHYQNNEYKVLDNVFSPKTFNAWKSFTPTLERVIDKNIDFLELGCGCGITTVHLLLHKKIKYAVLSDINPYAVQNAYINLKAHGLTKKATVIQSDIFDDISTNKKFDVIYWNYPWMEIELDYEFKSELERGLFDPGYKLLEKFFKEAASYLRKNGVIYIGWGDFGNSETLKKIAAKYNFDQYDVVMESGEEQNDVKFMLYEFRQKSIMKHFKINKPYFNDIDWSSGRASLDISNGLNLLKELDSPIISVFGSKDDSKYYEHAYKLGNTLGKKGYSVQSDALATDEIIDEKVLTHKLTIHYLFSRRFVISIKSNAMVYYPGDCGTLTEVFENIALIVDNLIDRVPVILIGRDCSTGFCQSLSKITTLINFKNI
jgi:release factor glutamine methyltransferase